MEQKFLIVNLERGLPVLKALASGSRLATLKLLHDAGPQNVNEITDILGLPQSSVSTNIKMLEDAGLVRTQSRKGIKGNQKICSVVYDEVLVKLKDETDALDDGEIEVSMPVGLYTGYEVTSPCGLCSPESIIGLLDTPNSLLSPERMKAGLIWFNSGYIEYQFPNNALINNTEVLEIEFSLELSSEVPGTHADWPSDIFMSINGVDIGNWTSPSDFGDKRGVYTPGWWKLKGSQYGKLKHWRVGKKGTFVDGTRISNVVLDDLKLFEHRSIRMRIGVHEDARHPGGINIFGRGFGNYDQDIILRTKTR